MKKKIAFLSLNAYEFFFETKNVTHGGAELQMYYLAKGISNTNKFDVKFIVGDYAQEKKIILGNIQFYKLFNLENKESNAKKTFKMMALFFKLIKLNPDVIITSSASSWLAIVAFYKIIFQKKHVHRTASLLEVNGKWIKQNGLKGKLFEFGLARADLVISQNIDHQELIKKHHQIEATVLKNGFKISATNAVTKLYILWVGRYDPIKQPELFIKLAEILPAIPMLMICPPNSYYQKEYELLKKDATKYQNLNFIEQVPFHQIQRYFDGARIFVNTSIAEGFPNTFLQAAVSSVPVFSLNVNPDNYLRNYQCGIYVENDFGELISILEKFFFENTDLDQMGKNHYEYFAKNHALENIQQQFNALIENLCITKP